jgi:hypothetical protein
MRQEVRLGCTVAGIQEHVPSNLDLDLARLDDKTQRRCPHEIERVAGYKGQRALVHVLQYRYVIGFDDPNRVHQVSVISR